ncbi:hypothetical protein BKA70DRAFT_1246765 [Coprinopsis sp. MPI-PUGE-AT-0042]|nr:hypothetical protein BKA70DRAFT_1246765 [Coprinopsis sp. MPI-PUGE-AT-0042]
METRRSSRLAQKPQAVKPAKTSTARANALPGGTSAPQRVATQRSTTKKQKTTHTAALQQPKDSQPRKRRAKLQNVGELPLELLLEVDLLNMSRTTKALRAIVLDLTLTGEAWKHAITTIEPALPLKSFPEGWSPVHITSMVYDRECQECGTVAGVTTHWFARAKLCNGCLPKRFTKYTCFNPAHQIMIVSRYTFYHKGGMWFPTKWVDEVESAIANFIGDQGALDKYTQDQKQNQKSKDLEQFGFSMRNWEYSKSRHKKDDVVNRRNARRNAYKGKLEALGYKQELAQMRTDVLETLPSFKGTKPLTDKEWARLEPQVVEIMDEVRRAFEERARRQVWDRRMYALQNARACYLSRHRGEVVAGMGDLASAEPFHSLIFGTPIDESVKLDDFVPLIDSIGSITKSWKEASDSRLLELLPATPTKAPTKKGKEKSLLDPGVLTRVATIFSCEWCLEFLNYPAVLEHPCLTNKHRGQRAPGSDETEDDGPDEKDLETDESEKEAEDPGKDPLDAPFILVRRWNEGNDQVIFDVEASELVKTIISLCGMNPDTATVQEMDDCDARIECVRCQNLKGKHPRLVMTWRHAILHKFEKHAEEGQEEPPEGTWALLTSDEDIAAVKAKERAQPKQPPRKQLCCTECAFVTIKNNSLTFPVYSTLDNDGKCTAGHDMSHGTIVLSEIAQYPRTIALPFKRYPNPVRI